MKIIKWILALITLISTIIMLFVFPDTVPVHFDINGVADRWGSKYELLVMPLMSLLCLVMFECISKFYTNKLKNDITDKEKSEIKSNVSVMNIASWTMLLLFLVMNVFFLYTAYIQVYPDKNLPEFDVMRAVCITMGVTFIIMGNYMPKTRRNSTIGFRFSWTLYNDTTWSKSNRFASYVMMVTGAVDIIAALLLKGIISTLVMLGSLLVSITIIMIYAYCVHSDEKRKDNELTN